MKKWKKVFKECWPRDPTFFGKDQVVCFGFYFKKSFSCFKKTLKFGPISSFYRSRYSEINKLQLFLNQNFQSNSSNDAFSFLSYYILLLALIHSFGFSPTSYLALLTLLTCYSSLFKLHKSCIYCKNFMQEILEISNIHWGTRFRSKTLCNFAQKNRTRPSLRKAQIPVYRILNNISAIYTPSPLRQLFVWCGLCYIQSTLSKARGHLVWDRH